jgi:hypothetical protein
MATTPSSNPLNAFEQLLPGLKTYIVSLVTIGYGVYMAIHAQNWQTGTVPVLIGSVTATIRAALEELKALGTPKL